jgi:hypothetical protein
VAVLSSRAALAAITKTYRINFGDHNEVVFGAYELLRRLNITCSKPLAKITAADVNVILNTPHISVERLNYSLKE